MTIFNLYVIVCVGIKQDRMSGKERLCCRFMQISLQLYIVRMIFREQVCHQSKKLNGLTRHAFTRPDQVEIWDQVHFHVRWNNQTDRSINAQTAACPNRQAALFLLKIEPPEYRRCEMFEIPFVNTVATGQNIDRLRIAAGLSVRDIQMVFGFATPQAIYKWIHGTSMPTIDNLVILAAMLDVTLDEIVVVDTAVRKCG